VKCLLESLSYCHNAHLDFHRCITKVIRGEMAVTGVNIFLSSSSSVVVTRLSGPRSRPTTTRKSGSLIFAKDMNTHMLLAGTIYFNCT
jgi:hypothetical protein